MINLGKFVHTETGKKVMSILLGLGLASLFRSICKGKNCMVFKAPPLEELKDKVYKYNNKCYKYVSHSAKCDKQKRIVHFDDTDTTFA